jgi:hypothetical protein
VSVFAVAASVIAADANVGCDALYTVQGGVALAVRAVLRAPDLAAEMGFVGGTVPAAQAMIPISAMPTTPEAGDTLQVGAVVYEVTEARRDGEGVSWMLLLRDLPAVLDGGALLRAIP